MKVNTVFIEGLIPTLSTLVLRNNINEQNALFCLLLPVVTIQQSDDPVKKKRFLSQMFRILYRTPPVRITTQGNFIVPQNRCHRLLQIFSPFFSSGSLCTRYYVGTLVERFFSIDLFIINRYLRSTFYYLNICHRLGYRDPRRLVPFFLSFTYS